MFARRTHSTTTEPQRWEPEPVCYLPEPEATLDLVKSAPSRVSDVWETSATSEDKRAWRWE
jgi:hypothetical protein